MGKAYERKDRLYNQAKLEGYRSRAAYKLIELKKRYKLLRPGMTILDLGAWPGGWLQVASQSMGNKGLIIGIDLQEIEPINSPIVHTIAGDINDPQSIEQIKALAPSGADLVLSDMSPKLSGIREADQAASTACAEAALTVSRVMLRSGGNLVIKLFKGQESSEFVKKIEPLFNKAFRPELKSSRGSSNEYYLVCTGSRN